MTRPLPPDLGAGAAEGKSPGWPARLEPLRVPAGVVRLRPVRLRDGREWRRIRLRDKDYLQRWEPTAPGSWEDRHSGLSWAVQWAGLRALARRGGCLPFAITIDGVFAGQLTIGNVVRAALRSGWIGYWIDSRHASGGAATAAVALAVDHAFGAARLHRLEATVRPDNLPSVRVLAKVGFRKEGLFERYLDVDGAWRDHLCFAITAEETGGGMASRLVADDRAEWV
ncbi:MAG: GNAT family N-acetyltransferase [Actinophytocola sp.]|nr:GNAT family N-acetyltransferase [Actinophytocola sp.]